MIGTSFAAIVPIGPTAIDLWRGVQLLNSLLSWEPALGWCVVLDDSTMPRPLSELSMFPRDCGVVTLHRPLLDAGPGWLGSLTAGILQALAWIQENTTADYVLRLDADALVIAPFSETLSTFLTSTPDVGVVGTLGLSSNPEVRRLQDDAWEPRLLRAKRLWPQISPLKADVPNTFVEVPTFGNVYLGQLRAFDELRPTLDAAQLNGYLTHQYCQGGACLFTRVMIDRMADRGYLRQAAYWTGLPFPDDGVMAMYAHAVGTSLCDFSKPGESFGVQHVGLPYPPDVLLMRRHSLIHSVKNDPAFSEGEIREYFSARQTVSPSSTPFFSRARSV